MKKFLPLAFLFARIIAAQTTSAQNMLGLGLTNQSGVHGVLINPARLANHPQRISVNLITVGAHLDNSFGTYQAPITISKMFNERFLKLTKHRKVRWIFCQNTWPGRV